MGTQTVAGNLWLEMVVLIAQGEVHWGVASSLGDAARCKLKFLLHSCMAF